MNQEFDNYFVEIEAHFIFRRRKNLQLSPKDWQLMESWQSQGIPLFVVLLGIDATFDKHAAISSKQTINSLAYCKSEVETAFASWAENQTGAHDAEQLAPISAETAADDFGNWLIVNNLFDEYLTADINRVREIANQFEAAN